LHYTTSDANDAIRLWRYSSFLQSGRSKLNCKFKLNFDDFEKFEPLNVVSHHEDPIRHILAWLCVFLSATVHQNPPTGHFSTRVRWKKYRNKIDKASYFTYFSRRFLLTHLYKFWVTCSFIVDVINCGQFYRNQLMGLDSVRGPILTIPIWMRCHR